MVAETYTVEASLQWRTNVPEVLRQIQQGFEDVDKLIRNTQANLGKFAADLREISTGGKGINSLARAMEKLKVPPAALDSLRDVGRLSSEIADAQGIIARDALQSARAFREMAEAARSIRIPGAVGTGAGRHGGGSHGSMLDAAMGAQMAGDAGMGLVERGFHAYAEVQSNEVFAQADKRVTDAVLGQANKLIASLQKRYPALTQAEGLTLFRNSMGIFGNADESMQALPGAVRLEQLYQLTPGGRGGSGGSEVQAAEKAGDAMQSFIDPKTGKLDTGLYSQWMDFQSRSYLAGGGLVDAKSWLAFARTSRSAGIGLSPKALEEAQALLEMSPGRTGTAMMSAFQVFGASTKHMTKGNRAAWSGAGLLQKDGNIIDQSLYQNDPFAWVWKDLVPKLAAHGFKTRDQILKWLTENGQRSTVAGLLSDIAIGKTPISNTATKMESQDPNTVDRLVNSDVGKLAAFHAAETNFFVALGKFGEGPGLKLLTKLTDALNGLTSWANDHPKAAGNLVMLGAGLAIVSKVAGDTAMAALFVGGPLVSGVRALGVAVAPFAPGGAAALALASMAALVGALAWSSGTESQADKREQEGHHFRVQRPDAYLYRKEPSSAPQITNKIYLNGKEVSKALLGSSTTQGGMTGHDGSMSLFPAGLPAGAGN